MREEVLKSVFEMVAALLIICQFLMTPFVLTIFELKDISGVRD